MRRVGPMPLVVGFLDAVILAGVSYGLIQVGGVSSLDG